MKKAIALVVILLVAAVAAWIWYRACGGVTHRELKDAITEESEVIQIRIDARYRALDEKLDRIEAKLDKLIDIATTKQPDGMKEAK